MNRIREVRRTLEERGLLPPDRVTLAITEGCNLGCGHCWVESPPHTGAAEVPREAVEGAAREFARFGAEEIWLTGGEPLTHSAWLRILAACARLPGIQRVGLQTNATLLQAEDVRGLEEIGPARLEIQVSLEGAYQAAHDRVRGRGSYEAAVRGLRLLAGGGLGNRIRVAFTEMKHNIEELPALLELAEGLGVGGLTSGSLVWDGRARERPGLAPPEPAQYRRLLEQYQTDERFRARCDSWARVTAIEWWKGRHRPDPHRCDFVASPYVSASGHMYPCVLLQEERYAGTGVYERPLADVILDALPLWAELRESSLRRPAVLEPCSACPGREHCAGGCVGRTLATHGETMTVEDRCGLRRAVYGWEGGTEERG